MKSKRILPFEVKTTQLSQAVILFLVPMLFGLPLFVSEDRRQIAYAVGLLFSLPLFLAFFLATQNSIRKGSDREP